MNPNAKQENPCYLREMEDDLQPEYDLRSLRVRRVGPQRSGFGKFNATEYLDSDEVIAEYLTAALEDENPDVFLAALADVAKARGMSKVAQSTGLGRESLYKALAPGAKPRYDTILKILHGLGVKIAITP